jgi:hypothetical protein
VSADTIIAACATVIALASVAVAVSEGRAARDHNRRSVRPILQIRKEFPAGERGGLRVTNVGLGPAAITRTELWLDGVLVGGTDRAGVDRVRENLPGPRPWAVNIGAGAYLATDYDQYLLSVGSYEPDRHEAFVDLVRHRLRIRITYDSLYGGESFSVERGPDV